jgi:hypothetical protein
MRHYGLTRKPKAPSPSRSGRYHRWHSSVVPNVDDPRPGEPGVVNCRDSGGTSPDTGQGRAVLPGRDPVAESPTARAKCLDRGSPSCCKTFLSKSTPPHAPEGSPRGSTRATCATNIGRGVRPLAVTRSRARTLPLHDNDGHIARPEPRSLSQGKRRCLRRDPSGTSTSPSATPCGGRRSTVVGGHEGSHPPPFTTRSSTS